MFELDQDLERIAAKDGNAEDGAEVREDLADRTGVGEE